MSTMTYGEVEWNQVGRKPRPERINTKDAKINFPAGKTKIRIVSKSQKCLYHYWKPNHAALDPAKQYKQGFKIKCTSDSSTCLLCQAGLDIVERYLWKVISRTENAIKIAEFSSGTAETIRKTLVEETEEWGNPINYDIQVTVDKTAPAAKYYNFMGLGSTKRPLNPEEVAMVQNYDDKILHTMLAPMEPDDQKRLMENLVKKTLLEGKTVSLSELLSGPVAVTEAEEFPPVN